MEGLISFSSLLAITTTMLVIKFSVISVKAQVSSPCTTSMITSFTPCINFITGSTANGTSPTPGCCDSVKSLMSGSMDCACLIVTGNVPVSLPFNRTLAISLPKACKSSLPIQCKVTGAQLPAPGPVLFAPPPPISLVSPLSPIADSPSPSSPTASKAASAVATPDLPPTETPYSPPAETPASPSVHAVPSTATSTSGFKPVVIQSSASNPSYIPSPFVLLVFIGVMVFKSY